MSTDHGSIYPETASQRDLWTIEQRGTRSALDEELPYAFFNESERFHNGEVGLVSTIFLTNRECPWHCVMCDLWRNTLTTTVSAGAIPKQIRHALGRLPAARQVKLYNSGSFFDPKAILPSEYPEIAGLVAGFERIIVESHPMLIGRDCFQLQALLRPKLEVAMGLETAHPSVLEKLNKKMTLDQYARAAGSLREREIDLRSFILVQPPFMLPQESLEWACKSIDFAFDQGATAVTLIPTRAGNGAMETLASHGDFAPPGLNTVEAAFEYGLAIRRGRVFVDMWDIGLLDAEPCCRAARLSRLVTMNLSQDILAAIHCDHSSSHP